VHFVTPFLQWFLRSRPLLKAVHAALFFFFFLASLHLFVPFGRCRIPMPRDLTPLFLAFPLLPLLSNVPLGRNRARRFLILPLSFFTRRASFLLVVAQSSSRLIEKMFCTSQQTSSSSPPPFFGFPLVLLPNGHNGPGNEVAVFDVVLIVSPQGSPSGVVLCLLFFWTLRFPYTYWL